MQLVKTRWRCQLCSMRRDLVAASGVWYHGGLAQPVISSASFRQKLTVDNTARTRHNSDQQQSTGTYLYAVSIYITSLTRSIRATASFTADALQCHAVSH